MHALSYEPKLRAARHSDRRTRIMRQYKDRCVGRRLIAPPPLPCIVRPRPSNWTEHVAPENPGANSSDAVLGNSMIDAFFSTLLAVHLPPGARLKEPIHQN